MGVFCKFAAASVIAAMSFAAFGGGALADSRMFVAYLYGGNEVPAAGDPDAFGIATVVLVGPNGLCYSIILDNTAIPATAAHIHPGAAGVSNPPVVALVTPTGDPSRIVSCLGVPPATITAIRTNPQDFYVNVHNGPFPGGAARGQ